MASYLWLALNSAGGAFDNANNWNNLTTSNNPALSPPGAGDQATLSAGGGNLTDTGAVNTLAFTGASWTIGGQITANTVTVDNAAVGAAANGSELITNAALDVGLAGAGTLYADNGGIVDVASGPSGAPSSFGNANLYVGGSGLASFGNLDFGVSASTTATISAAALAIGGAFLVGDGGVASVTVENAGEVVLSAAADASQSYLQLGVLANTAGSVQVSGPGSVLLVASNSGSVGNAGSGALTINGGGSARFNSGNNALDPALTIGQQQTGSGTVVVTGSGSTLAAAGSFIVGKAGGGTLQVLGGASATSLALTSGQAALAVAAGAGGSGTVVVDGTGSQLVASGQAVIGGDNRGSAMVSGGVGTVVVTDGGYLQTGSTTVEAGSSVTVDGSSQELVAGDLTMQGTLSTFGTLSISGTLVGPGALRVAGGFTAIGNVASANISFAGSNATVRLSNVTGSNSVSGMQFGDAIDLTGNTNVRLTGDTVTTTTGTIQLSVPTSAGQYALAADGNGGTFVSLDPDTIGVYRFFDSNYGTHFFTASSSEENTIMATRSDLVFEGVGLQSVDPSSNDPNASAVYRFFDTTYGTHFFTASASERDTVISSRPDLVYEGTGFLEHTQQEAGDVGVYRFFDTHYGTHFYTSDPSERATILATRPDLVDEGIGFYAPSY